MTQPVCAYEGCGRVQDSTVHSYQDYMPESVINHEFQPQSTVESTPASASPQGAGEACSDCDGSGRTATGSPAVPWRYCTTCRAVEKDRAWLLKRADEEDRTMLTLPTVAQGAVPGPQDGAAPKSAQFLLRSWMGTHASDCGCKLCGDTRKRLATPEPHSPHVHNFDANGICVTMGCTPAGEPRPMICQACCTNVCSHNRCPNCHTPCAKCAEPAASTDERLTEIAERESKATKGEWIWEDWQQDFGDDKYTLSAPAETRPNGPSDMFPTLRNKIISDDEYEISQEDRDFIAHARADIPYLLRLVAELRSDLNSAGRAIKSAASIAEEWMKRAEQAERERDELRQRIAVLEGK